MRSTRSNLLSTTALVSAIAMCSTAALAEEKEMEEEMEPVPPHLSVGGYYFFDAHFADVDGSDANSQQMQHDLEVHFRASAELANGIKIGGRIELEGNAGHTIDDHFLTLSSGWGTVMVGATDGVSNKTAVGAPNGGYGVTSGVQTEWLIGSDADGQEVKIRCAFRCTGGGSNLDAGNDDTGIHYFSPSFGGFSFAVGYRPEASGAGSNNKGPIAPDTVYQDAVDAAVRYSGELGGVGINASVGVGSADGGGAPDYEHVVAGLSLSAMGFTVGGRMADEGTDGPNNGNSYSAGVAYTQGPWKVGIDGFSGSRRDTDAPGDSEYDAWAISGTYAVGPGLRVLAGFQSGSIDHDDAGAVDGSAFTAGMAVNF